LGKRKEKDVKEERKREKRKNWRLLGPNCTYRTRSLGRKKFERGWKEKEIKKKGIKGWSPFASSLVYIFLLATFNEIEGGEEEVSGKKREKGEEKETVKKGPVAPISLYIISLCLPLAKEKEEAEEEEKERERGGRDDNNT